MVSANEGERMIGGCNYSIVVLAVFLRCYTKQLDESAPNRGSYGIQVTAASLLEQKITSSTPQLPVYSAVSLLIRKN